MPSAYSSLSTEQQDENVARASRTIDWALTQPATDWRTDALPAEDGTVVVLLDNGFYGVNWAGVQPADMELMKDTVVVRWLPVAD